MSSAYQRRQVAKRELEIEAKAHRLRHYPTLSEERLWTALRSRRLGVAFRRQVVIGLFIADFACAEARLVVEVDGGVHRDRARLDAHRDERLGRAGYRVVRLPAELVTSNLPAAVALVRAALGA